MTTEVRFVHYIKITDKYRNEYRYQNYFISKEQVHGHLFVPFQVQGNVANLGGDNAQIQLLFPANQTSLALVEKGDGNRQSRLILSTFNVTPGGVRGNLISTEFYIGLGASFSEDTIELRFNTAIDSVATNFPARRLTQDNVGYLPLDSALSLR